MRVLCIKLFHPRELKWREMSQCLSPESRIALYTTHVYEIVLQKELMIWMLPFHVKTTVLFQFDKISRKNCRFKLTIYEFGKLRFLMNFYWTTFRHRLTFFHIIYSNHTWKCHELNCKKAYTCALSISSLPQDTQQRKEFTLLCNRNQSKFNFLKDKF